MHDADVAVGDLRSLWKRAPRLEHLVIAQPNTVSLGTVVAPHLKTLVFGGPLPGAIKALASAKLPALETLLVRVSSAAQVKALLANHKLGRVKHLGLIRAPGRNADPKPGDQLLEALVASPRIADLETLDLGGVSASPKGWERLAAAAPRMKKLREVRLTSWEIDPSVLDTDDWMDDVVEQLQGVNYRPKDEPIGKRLASALPVRWLPATVVSVDEEARKHRGWFRGMLWGGEGYAEDRRRV